ncbi:MAG: peptidoglycan DD-metalloendopeptidase family protein [bacterium]|nr:peptidoglycan DD-metalloendopeptidase family protein [bacterium]MDZ4231539.1 peptidoglycan DD-metalloendopeptidase family protein [Patescibacteria group bacterium]
MPKAVNRGVCIASTLLVAGLVFVQSGVALAAVPAELQGQIEAKRKEVDKLNQQITQTQTQIGSLQGQAKTLQGAIAQIDDGIQQATLNLRSSEVNIEKLTLEIRGLSYETEEVGEEIHRKQSQVGDLLRAVQRRDKYGFLESLLTSQSLADGLSEINALKALQNNISAEASQLAKLQEQLIETINVSSGKKDQLGVEVVNLVNRKVILDEQKGEKSDLLDQTENQESAYQSLLTTLEQQQRALLEEISEIETQLNKNFDRSSVPSRQTGYLAWPVTNSGARTGIITQNYGETAYSTRFYKGRPHNGTDIAAPTGTEVRAGADGVVARVDYNGLNFQYGRYILIDHGNGLTTLYAHLSGSAVSQGQSVGRGDLIGYVGSTGFSTGSHLHYGLYATPSGGWRTSTDRAQGGLFSIPPASGLVPIGVTLNPQQYL